MFFRCFGFRVCVHLTHPFSKAFSGESEARPVKQGSEAGPGKHLVNLSPVLPVPIL